ncbi:MAG TPA: SRPBCC family protein [Bradyrhizobium sp.]|uniref:SRPBCC family protein n=1 Tax=Bradyrhizobium sp. TaxID=376 RepID=UPI002D1E1AC0|nr:SRPBCC family protein [Bradyrhizobium sp.]HLZ03571.1 SRPBCC family protein [Bradyrhizobium sp.]
MARAYYSTVFREPAAVVWKIIRDFNNYPVWVGGAGESEIEDGKTGDAVGAVRSVHYKGRHIRQRLLALSDVERSQTYEFCGSPSLPVTGFRATLQIREIVDGNGAFAEWWADFDAEEASREELCATLRGWFGQWLESLRSALARGAGRKPIVAQA